MPSTRHGKTKSQITTCCRAITEPVDQRVLIGDGFPIGECLPQQGLELVIYVIDSGFIAGEPAGRGMADGLQAVVGADEILDLPATRIRAEPGNHFNADPGEPPAPRVGPHHPVIIDNLQQMQGRDWCFRFEADDLGR